MDEHCDLLVIGAGPGGVTAALTAASFGKKVILVHASELGGACLHQGTIPSKSLQASALAKRSYPEALVALAHTKSLNKKILEYSLEQPQILCVQGKAVFHDEHTADIKSAGRTITAKFILLATGSSPIHHADIPFHLPGVFDSDAFLSLKNLPCRLLIYGAGVIGCEYASILAEFGAQVTLVDRRADLLRFLDPDLVEALKRQLQGQNVNLLLSAKVENFHSQEGQLLVSLNGESTTFDAMLVCMGRNPNTAELGIEQTGLQLDPRGHILVNPKTYQSSKQHIFAVGDVIGAPGLAGTAFEQGRIAVQQMFGRNSERKNESLGSFPTGIYTIPELACIGKTEWDLTNDQIPFFVAQADFDQTARGILNQQSQGFLKILVHKETQQILGVHIQGERASELVHLGQLMVQGKMTVSQIAEMVFNYPTYGELFKIAAQKCLLKA